MSTLKPKYNSNQIIVNNKSNFKCHLVKGQAILDNIHFDELVIVAMGKATTRALNLAVQLNKNNFNSFELKPRTYSVDIWEDKSIKQVKCANKDGFDPDSINISEVTPTQVPAIEIIVRKSQLEINKMRQSRNQSTSIGTR